MTTLKIDPIKELPDQFRLVHQVLERVGDKWTLLVLDALEGNKEVRHTQLRKKIPSVSQKMLTQTLRQLERDGLLIRRVHATVPPQVDYRLTPQGKKLNDMICVVWKWVDKNLKHVERSRVEYDKQKAALQSRVVAST